MANKKKKKKRQKQKQKERNENKHKWVRRFDKLFSMQTLALAYIRIGSAVCRVHSMNKIKSSVSIFVRLKICVFTEFLLAFRTHKHMPCALPCALDTVSLIYLAKQKLWRCHKMCVRYFNKTKTIWKYTGIFDGVVVFCVPCDYIFCMMAGFIRNILDNFGFFRQLCDFGWYACIHAYMRMNWILCCQMNSKRILNYHQQ